MPVVVECVWENGWGGAVNYLSGHVQRTQGRFSRGSSVWYFPFGSVLFCVNSVHVGILFALTFSRNKPAALAFPARVAAVMMMKKSLAIRMAVLLVARGEKRTGRIVAHSPP